jgi:hypothetical protein
MHGYNVFSVALQINYIFKTLYLCFSNSRTSGCTCVCVLQFQRNDTSIILVRLICCTIHRKKDTKLHALCEHGLCVQNTEYSVENSFRGPQSSCHINISECWLASSYEYLRWSIIYVEYYIQLSKYRVGSCLTKKKNQILARKENSLPCVRRCPRATHVSDMGLFRQTMP